MTRISKRSSKLRSIPENRDWTSRSTDDFVSRITFDFARQIEQCLDAKEENQAILAGNLGLTEGRVSQTLNHPASMSLKTVVRYARAVGRKVAIVLYNDGDHENSRGPINSEIFSNCWEKSGKPSDFFELRSAKTSDIQYTIVAPLPLVGTAFTPAAYWNPWRVQFTEIGSTGEMSKVQSGAVSANELRTFVQ